MARGSTGKVRRRFASGVKLTLVGGRVIVRRRNRPLGALVSMRDLKVLQAIEDRMDLAAAEEALAQPGSVPWEQVKANLGLR